MEREVGGGIGMGNTCKPMAVSFQCMTKSTTKKKQQMLATKNRNINNSHNSCFTWESAVKILLLPVTNITLGLYLMD